MAHDQTASRDAFAIELPVGIAAVEQGRLALLDYFATFTIDGMTINRIEVILEEIVSNVARHGVGASSLWIKAECTAGSIRLAFEDNGERFNPFDMPEPDAFTTAAEATLGGQGIPLVKRLSRSVGYERVGKLNRVVAIVSAH